MKKHQLILLAFSIWVIGSVQAQSEQPVSSSEESAYADDSATLLGLIGQIRTFRQNYDDTEVQQKAKKRKLEEALVRINTTWKGKTLSLKAAQLKDVGPEKELSPMGIQQQRALIEQLKKDPASAGIIGDGDLQNNPALALIVAMQLAFCEACWRETGKFEAEYSIPVPGQAYDEGIAVEMGEDEPLSVKIKKFYPNEDSVIDLKKKSVAPLTGKIINIFYVGGSIESLEIELE